MIKKIVMSIIVVAILALFFVGYSHFIGFEAWTKQTRADFGILSTLNKLSIFVFISFSLLALIKKYSSKSTSKSITDNIHDITYIIVFCVTLTLIIPLIIFKVSFIWFIINLTFNLFVRLILHFTF